MNSRYLWAMDVLENPSFFEEKYLQEAVEILWDVLFHEYKLVERTSMPMPNTWRPDLVGYSGKEKTVLVIELKTKPPSGSKAKSLRQVKRYVQEVMELFPETKVKPVLIGPWEKHRTYSIEDVNGMKVQFINVMNLGGQVHNLFENMVRWCLDVPFPNLRVDPVADEWIRKLPAVTSIEEDDDFKKKSFDKSYTEGTRSSGEDGIEN